MKQIDYYLAPSIPITTPGDIICPVCKAKQVSGIWIRSEYTVLRRAPVQWKTCPVCKGDRLELND